MIKIAIADDDQILLRTFRDYFYHETHIECTFTTSDLEELLEFLADRKHIDYLFLDIDFHGVSSLSYLSKIKKLRPQLDVIIFTQNTSDDNLFKALCGGAIGFLPKSLALKNIKDYIKILLQDGAAITPQLAKRLMQHFRPAPVVDEKSSNKKILTELDTQILELMASGYSYQQIAEMTNISINGVRYHIKKIYKALHVNNKIDAVRKYRNGEF